jgi:hypothetical protein
MPTRIKLRKLNPTTIRFRVHENASVWPPGPVPVSIHANAYTDSGAIAEAYGKGARRWFRKTDEGSTVNPFIRIKMASRDVGRRRNVGDSLRGNGQLRGKPDVDRWVSPGDGDDCQKGKGSQQEGRLRAHVHPLPCGSRNRQFRPL